MISYILTNITKGLKMQELTNRETLSELSSLLPKYKDRLKEAEKEYDRAKKDSVLTDTSIEHLDNFIVATKETLKKMDRCVTLAQNIPEKDPLLKETTDELKGYHKYILDADIFILKFLKEA